MWDPALCIQCNKCALVCPHAAIRVKVYDDDALDGRAGRRSSTCRSRDRISPASYTVQVAPEDCTGCALCVMSARRRTRPTRATRRSTWRRRRRCARPSATNYAFFLEPAGGRSHGGQRRRQEHAVPAAAVRVLGRVRRLRRDAVHQADDAAVRRSRADRERHRLLVDLRRQPADDAVHASIATAAARRGRTRCSRTTPSSGSACGSRSISTRRARAQLLDGAAPAAAATRSPTRSCRRRSARRGRHPGAARAGRRAAAHLAADELALAVCPRRRSIGWPTTS